MNCGCEFSMWVRVFNLHFPDKMQSCRHKRDDGNLVATGKEKSLILRGQSHIKDSAERQ